MKIAGLTPAFLLMLTVLTVACGGTPPAPTTPTPVTLSPPTGLTASVTHSGITNTLRAQWTAVPRATAYAIEIGTSESSADVMESEIESPALEAIVPAGRLWVRVASVALGQRSAFASTALNVPDMKVVIEALILGTGPLSEVNNPGCVNTLEVIRGWPRGSRVRVVAYNSINPSMRDALQQMVQQLRDAFGTALTFDYQQNDALDAPADHIDGEIAVSAHDTASSPCPIPTGSCHLWRGIGLSRPGAYRASRVLLNRSNGSDNNPHVLFHELGHAVALCHIQPERAGLPRSINMMSGGSWTSIDSEVFRLVYGVAGLSAGDSRERLRGAGLIH